MRTPRLDALARQGTRMSCCITPNVVCQPARASMLTGLLPMTHGVSDNGIDLDASVARQGFAGHLAAAGYHTAFVGKAHFSTYHTFEPSGTPECVASSHLYGDDWYGPYMGFEHVELMLIGHNYWLPETPPRGQHYERWYHQGGRGEQLHALYRQRLAPQTTAPQTFHSGLPVEVHNSTWVADRTLAQLRKVADGDQPFCLWASFADPHHPFDAPQPWSRLHHPDEVDLPRYRRRDFESRPWWHRASVESTPDLPENLRRIRQEYSRMPELDDRQLREVIANYYGMIALIDQQVGRILDGLAELELQDDTIVVFTSDHGEWLGDHGLMLKGPMMYDGLLRVALIVRGPGVAAGRVVHEPVSTLDLAPSFAHWAGVAPHPSWQGTSLHGVMDGSAGRDFALNEWDLRPGRCGVALRLVTVRTARWRMTLEQHSGAGELYDLHEDPHERINRFDDPAARRARRELAAMLAQRESQALVPPLAAVGTA